MSLTSYRAAPPRAKRIWFPECAEIWLSQIFVSVLADFFVCWNDEGPLLAALAFGQGPFVLY